CRHPLALHDALPISGAHPDATPAGRARVHATSPGPAVPARAKALQWMQDVGGPAQQSKLPRQAKAPTGHVREVRIKTEKERRTWAHIAFTECRWQKCIRTTSRRRRKKAVRRKKWTPSSAG